MAYPGYIAGSGTFDPVVRYPQVSASFQFWFQNALFGPNTDFEIRSIEGLDLPEVRNGDLPRVLDQGELMGQDYLAGRTITITLDVYPASALPALISATSPQSIPQEWTYWLQTPAISTPVGGTCRARRRSTPVDLAFALGNMAKAVVELHATDPLLYQSTASTPIPWGGGANLVCGGTASQGPLIVVTGPLSTSSVYIGSYPVILAPIGAGQTYTIDMRTHEILLNGAPSPGSVLAGTQWWLLAPGATNLVGFSSQDSSQPAGSSCVVTYSPAAWTSAV